MRRWSLAIALAAAVACGGPVTVDRYGPPLGRYLLTLSEMGTADFVVQQPEHAIGPDWLSLTAAGAVRDAGFQSGVEVDFLRSNAGDLAVVNGPTDVRASVATFGDDDSAQRALVAEATGLLARKGAEEISTGVLGDSAMATSELATFQGVDVVQITVVWRSANLVNSIVIHGRYGGARLDDALTLAHRQQENELNGGPPLPTSAQTPTASARPAVTAHPTATARPSPIP